MGSSRRFKSCSCRSAFSDFYFFLFDFTCIGLFEAFFAGFTCIGLFLKIVLKSEYPHPSCGRTYFVCCDLKKFLRDDSNSRPRVKTLMLKIICPPIRHHHCRVCRSQSQWSWQAECQLSEFIVHYCRWMFPRVSNRNIDTEFATLGNCSSLCSQKGTAIKRVASMAWQQF